MSLDTADVAYLHKLTRGKRDKRLIAAFLLLLFALRRLRPGASRPELETALRPIVGTLAAGIAAYVGRQTASHPAAPPIAAALLTRIARYAAQAEADPGLIARAELQRATAEATRRAGEGRTLRRETTSPNPCDRCAQLAGTYTPPWPHDVFETHPNCCCAWQVVAGKERG